MKHRDANKCILGIAALFTFSWEGMYRDYAKKAAGVGFIVVQFAVRMRAFRAPERIL
jgi:hypothetical protein